MATTDEHSQDGTTDEHAPHLHCERRFLDAPESGSTALVMALIDRGEARITVADNERSVTLDFMLGTTEERKHSLEKADALHEALTTFRATLHREVARLEQRPRLLR